MMVCAVLLFASRNAASHWELLETCCVGEFRACGARRTLGTCPVFAKPVGTNFTRSRRFREVPHYKTLVLTALSKRFWLKTPTK
ncbi:hypothetical protein AEM42_01915 [Betaproteobacteria bacterium UKL13-2]|nr:hypothetical protein AEM42_01915 [Betaproteobacteria bacterium UKL13-2]